MSAANQNKGVSNNTVTLRPNTRSNTKTNSPGTYSATTPSNSDLMAALNNFRDESLSTTSTLSNTLTSKLNDLKSDFLKLSELVSNLKTENAKLRLNVDQLNTKVATLEASLLNTQPSTVVSQVMQETFERERCSYNLLVYNIPESSSSSSTQRISDDKASFSSLVEPLVQTIPSNLKLFRLGKVQTNNTRPLKVIFQTKEAAAKFLQDFTDAKTDGKVFSSDLRIVRDKTSLQRSLLKSCHLELDQRSKDGENDLSIKFINGLPKVVRSKNGISQQRHRRAES